MLTLRDHKQGEINPLVTQQESGRILQILEEVTNQNFVKQN